MWRLVTFIMIATFRRFRSVYNSTLLLVTFCLWFVVVEVATLITNSSNDKKEVSLALTPA